MDPAARRSELALPRRVEVVAALSVAIDLGLGQPAEHMLRTVIIACRLADRLGLSRIQRDTTYYTALIMWIGCNADSQEYARWFGDDIAVRRDAYLTDWTGLPFMRFLLSNIARGEPMAQRLLTMGAMFRDARGQLGALMHSHCLSAAALANHIGLPPEVERAVGFTFERFDGSGLPRSCPGDQIPIEMRIAQLADTAEVHHRMYGLDAAVAMARSRRGEHFDPAVVDALLEDPNSVFAALTTGDAWSAATAEAPDTETRLDDDGLNRLVCAIGDFADLKCPFALGHSRAVAALAVGAGELLGLETTESGALRRAGHLHDIGKLGVFSQIWSKRDLLTVSEWERVRIHPYFTDRVLSPITGLERERTYARAHHEHLDGTGNRQIAEKLVISEKTVRNQVERTYAKIGATNRVGASLYALQHGLATPAAP